MARKSSMSTISPLLVLCLVALMMFAFLHIRSFSQLSNAHDAQNSQNTDSQQLRARLEQLTNAVKINSEKLDALERKEALEKSSSSGINPSKTIATSTPVPSRYPGNRYDRMHIALPPNDNTKDKKTSSESTAVPKSAPDLPKSLSKGYKQHPILTLSDEQLRHEYTISDMMSWYGEAKGGGSCGGDFGNELVRRWRGTKQTYCKNDGSGSGVVGGSSGGESGNEGVGGKGGDGAIQSSIDCYLVHQTRHHGNGDNLCVMYNVAVNLGIFGDDGVTRPVVQHYVDTQHNEQPYVKWPKGFVQAVCSPDASLWKGEVMPGWNEDWTTRAVQPITTIFQDATAAAAGGEGSTSNSNGGNNGGGNSVVCDEWVDHPVLVVQRDTFANFFHDSEDFVNVFLALAILQWTAGDTQLFLTDLYPQGPFWEMWSEVYSQGTDAHSTTPSPSMTAMTAWDLRNSYGQKKSSINTGKNQYQVCFKQLAIGIYGPAAPVTVASWDTPCSHTALVRAYSDYVIRGLGIHSHTHYHHPSPLKTVVVTYMARRASSEWPEKKFCSDTASFFLCRLWANFGVRRLGRMVSNDAEVVTALKGLEKKQFANGAQVKFQDVDFNLLSFKEQIEVDLATDVMVGPHGAGLMHNIFMRDRAALVELFVDGSGNNRHFHNLAHWFGRAYEGVTISNPINVPELLKTVTETINKIDINAY